jgi:hypothetical protein
MAPNAANGAGAGSAILERQVITWAAGLAAAAAIGYVVLGSYLLSFGWTSKMEKDVVPGLYNRYGNDCFANSVVQVHPPPSRPYSFQLFGAMSDPDCA